MIGTNVGSIEWDARINTGTLKADALKANAIASQTGDDIGSSMEKGEGRASQALSKMVTFAKYALVATAAATTAAIGKFVIGGGISRALNIEDAQAKLKGLGHDVQSLQSIMDSALKSVKGTAYGLDEAATTAATAVAAGIKPGQELTRYLKLTADGAAIAGGSMSDMGRVFNKVQTVQAAYNDSLLELSEKGIPIYQWLSKEMGVSALAVKKLASEGKVSSEVFLRAVEKNIGGAALASGNTTRGAWENMKAAMARVGAAIVEDIIPKIRDGFNSLTKWFDANSATIVTTVGNIATKIKEFATAAYALGIQVGTYLAPHLTALWNTINQNLIPALMNLWTNVLQPLIPVIGTALVFALGVAIGAINVATNVLSFLFQLIADNPAILAPLIAAFVALKVTMAIQSAIAAFSLGMAIMRGEVATTSSTLIAFRTLAASPIAMGAITVVAALAAIWSVYTAVKTVIGALRDMDNASKASEAHGEALTDSLQRIKNNPNISPQRKAELMRQVGANAQGTDNWGGGMTWVGEQGPELIDLPKHSRVLSNEDSMDMMQGSGGNNVTINLSLSGIMSRSKADERDIAKNLIKLVNDELSAKNVPVIGGGAI